MPSSDLIEPTRLESLIGGAAPETEREALVQGLVRQLQAGTPKAPPALRERVGALQSLAPKTRIPIGRRTVLALATMTLVLGAGVLAALTIRQPEQVASPRPTAIAGTATTSHSGDDVEALPSSGAPEPPIPQSVTSVGQYALDETFSAARNRSSTDLASKLPFPSEGTRAQDVDMSIELRVADAGELSTAANEAMRETRELGGLIVSSRIDADGEEGLARLDLRIPVRRLEDALLRLSGLGTITGQQVATRDLQGGIDRRAGQLLALQRAIERDRLIIESGTLSAEERLEVQLRLARERARAQDLRRERTALIREASMADLSLTLHTRAAPKGDKDEDGVAGAAADAWDFLGGAGAVAVFGLVILSPLLALVAVLWAVLRTRRRRLDDRLLEQPRPHAPPS